jgi:ubiquinone/menaquinone biosynthesis C-methylase UbiE
MNQPPNLFTDGEAYERMMGRWSQPVGEQFLDWLALPKGLRCLDVGCGNGAFTEVLIAKTAPAEVTGIDPSEEQLAYARTRPGAKLAQFQVGDAQALPFADGSFDAATMALVISFLPEPAKAVAGMARVVRPGGWVGTYMWDALGGGLPLQPMYDVIKSFGVAEPRSPNPGASRQETMRDLWQRAGLEAVETRVFHIPVVFSSLDEFWQSNAVGVGPVGKVLQTMSPAAKDQLKVRLGEQLPKDAQGRISYRAHANAVKGQVPA